MSRQEDFQDHVKLMRGIQTTPDKVDYSQIGVHWTDNRDTAEVAAGRDHGVEGTIVHAMVPKSNIVHRNSREHKALAHFLEIRPYAEEQERTVRPGASVKVVGVEHKGRTEHFADAKEVAVNPHDVEPEDIADIYQHFGVKKK